MTPGAAPLAGTLRSWNEERGFGFIAPTAGGRELFVHVSAFPRDGSRPTVGESLMYELGRGPDGRPRAVRVYRQALGPPSTYPRARPADITRRRRPRLTARIGVVLLAAAGAYAYSIHERQNRPAPQPVVAPAITTRIDTPPPPNDFKCDGRTHCSQMTSCSEARFFLKNCPGTKMDGDNNGIPCERQWCTSDAAP